MLGLHPAMIAAQAARLRTVKIQSDIFIDVDLIQYLTDCPSRPLMMDNSAA